MSKTSCRRCGGRVFVESFISLRCPVCGEYIYAPDASGKLLWAEHKIGLMLKKGGWRWMEVIDPPAWFLEDVV